MSVRVGMTIIMSLTFFSSAHSAVLTSKSRDDILLGQRAAKQTEFLN